MATYSTLADAKAAYLDNADYAELGSAAKARAFVTACRSLLVLLPQRSMATSHQVEFNPVLVHKELAEAKTWLAINGTNSGTGGTARAKYLDLSGMRD